MSKPIPFITCALKRLQEIHGNKCSEGDSTRKIREALQAAEDIYRSLPTWPKGKWKNRPATPTESPKP